MEFNVSSDTTSILFTSGTLLVFVLLAFWHLITWKKSKGEPVFWLRNGFLLILCFVLGYCYLVRPRKYIVNHNSLIIKRLWNNVQIPHHQILDCRQVSAADMNGTVRTFGIGGLFGYYGNYHNSTIGQMKFYATRFGNFVLIHTLRGEAIILTPDKPKEMVDEITSDITINN